MKIYFGFTVAGDRSSIAVAAEIVELLIAMGHEVLTSHLVRNDAREADRMIGPQQVYQRDMKWLDECDLFMAEVSGSSFGLGFETGYTLGATEKSVVLFYRRDIESKLSLLITGITHPDCTLVPYSNFEEASAWIAKMLPQLESLRLVRQRRSEAG
jgi:nucleoside 2-deoxyribosyltransferase